MKLYRVHTPHGFVWYGTQADAKLGAKGLNSFFQPVDVPTMPKEQFIDWLNDQAIMPSMSVEKEGPGEDPLEQAELRAVAAARAVDSRPVAADGHPEVRSAYTVAQIAASALPRSLSVQEVCHIIAKMHTGDLGYVALEVMVRAAKLGGVPQVGTSE